MFNENEIFEETNNEDSLIMQLSTDPLAMEGLSKIFEKVSEKVDLFEKSESSKVKYKHMSELVEYINSLDIHEIRILMANSSEIVRSVSAKAYIYKTNGNCVDSLNKMLDSRNIYLIDSAVIALNYLNSPDNISLLEKAANTGYLSIKKRALTGIADIANDHSCDAAGEILRKFINDDNKEIRDLATEELNVLNIFNNSENLTLQDFYNI